MPPSIPMEYLRQLELAPVKKVELGCFGVFLEPASELESAQEGYGGDDWSPSWLVIGRNTGLGDPYFIDLAKPGFPVYTAMHGCGEWEPRLVGSSFQRFAEAMAALASFCEKRMHPAGLKQNPITKPEFAEFARRLRAELGEGDAEFWIDFVAFYAEADSPRAAPAPVDPSVIAFLEYLSRLGDGPNPPV